jgi:hypothetical protein
MGTTENNLVHAGSEQGGQMLTGFLDKVRFIEAQGFDSGGPAGTGFDAHLYRSRVSPDQVRQPLAARRRFRRQDRDAATARERRSRFDAGLDADHCESSGKVSRKAATAAAVAVLQATTMTGSRDRRGDCRSQHPAANVGVVLVPIGKVSGIGKVDQIGAGQRAGDGCQYRKTAEAAVENANHRVRGAAPPMGHQPELSASGTLRGDHGDDDALPRFSACRDAGWRGEVGECFP